MTDDLETTAVPDPRFRGQLAEALTQLDYRDLPLGYARDVLARATKTPGSFVSLADALMPVIAAEVEARTRTAAAQKAAAELRDAAVAIATDQHVDIDYIPDVLRDRAAALTQPDGQQPLAPLLALADDLYDQAVERCDAPGPLTDAADRIRAILGQP